MAPGKDGSAPCLLLLPGGGGNKTKSGVKNKINIMKYVGEKGCESMCIINTDDLCCCIAAAVVDGDSLICAAYADKCELIKLENNDGKITHSKLLEFGATELIGEENTIDRCMFVGNRLVAAGYCAF
jgi:hypothetical protein